MIKIGIAFIILFHGLIHLMGFAKAFKYALVPAIQGDIGKISGMLWLIAALLLLISSGAYFMQWKYFWLIAGIAFVISEILILQSWQSAKFGTIANALLLILIVVSTAHFGFIRSFEQDVIQCNKSMRFNGDILTLDHLSDLPAPVKKYVIRSGAVGKEIPHNFKVKMTGKIRASENSEWMNFNVVQYSFIDSPARLFLMEAVMKHLPVTGYHHYISGKAVMDIRLLSLFKVQYAEGKEMDISETVTFFNDMCLMAPGALIDHRIKWIPIDDVTVKAIFSTDSISISAILKFNEVGELVNFISEDRYYTSSDKTSLRTTWSTPVHRYTDLKGFHLMGEGDAVYSLKEGDFTYGVFLLTDIAYNVK